jgi:RecB family endonuclease NucS
MTVICKNCKWSDEPVNGILTCWHIKHQLHKCSEKELECSEYEVKDEQCNSI